MLNHPFNVLRHVDQYNRVNRDPVTIATFIAPGIMAAGGTAAFLLTTAVYLGISAVATWAVSALTPKPSMPNSAGMTGIQTNTRDAAAPFEIVYGQVRKGGVITFMESRGEANNFLRMIIVLAGHEVEEIGDIYIDDEIVTVNGSGNVTNAPWNSKINIQKHTGANDQLADDDLVTNSSVDSTFRGRGIAYLYVTLTWNQEVFANGIPLITAVVKGKKVYDPRTDTTAWSANAALCVRDYIRSDYGVNDANSTINDDSFETAADICDENVGYALGGGEARYEVNGVLSTADTPRTNLQKLMTTCGGTLFWGQGKWTLKVGKYTNPVKNFNLDDLRGPINLITKVSRRENFNTVRGTFANKNQGYILSDYPQVDHAAYLTEDDGVENILDLTLPLTVTHQSAQRLAKLTLNRAREQIVVNADFSLKAFEVQPGDVITLDIDRYGWDTKAFEVTGWKLLTDSEDEGLRVNLSLKETSATAFQWNADEKEIVGNNSDLPDPWTSADISNLVATVTGFTDDDGDGRYVATVELTWDEPDNPFISYYEVKWKRDAASKWKSTTTDDLSIVLDNLRAQTLYNFKVRGVSLGGFRGEWVQVNQTTNKKSAAPGVPTSLDAVGGPGRIHLTWTNPTDKDFSHVTIWRNNTNDSSTATKVQRTDSESWTDRLDPGLTRYYWLKSVDTSGNASAFSTGDSATSRKIQTADVDTSQITKDLIAANAVSKRSQVTAGDPNTGDNVVATAVSYATSEILVSGSLTRDGGDAIVIVSTECGEASNANSPALQFWLTYDAGTETIIRSWKHEYNGNKKNVMTYAVTDTTATTGSVTYRLRVARTGASTGTPETYETNMILTEINK